MRFNIKLIEYPLSKTATVSIFDDLVGSEEGSDKNPPVQSEPQPFIDPFTGEEVPDIETIEDEVDVYDRQQRSIESSIRRSKRNVLHLMRSMDLSDAFFITLTFDKTKVDRQDFDQCCKKARIWLQNIRRYAGAEDMAFICVPELHRDMVSWHLHAVISNVGNMPMSDSGHKDAAGRPIYNLTGWRFGFSTAVKLDGTDPMTSIKLSKYMTKYFTKESQMIAKNRHRYFASNNIPKPEIHRWQYENDADLNTILSQIINKGYTFVSENTYEGYVNARYIEAIKEKEPD